MKPTIKYLELKTGFSDDGPAWIGLVSFSKTGKTLYFNGRAFQSLNGTGVSGNYFDLETNEEYWISGVKKDGADRHLAGGGNIMVEKRILSEYLKLIDKTSLPKSGYTLTEVQIKKPVAKIYAIENEQFLPEEYDSSIRFKKPNELSIDELEFVINDLLEEEKYCSFNKARRSFKKSRIEFEEELEDRKRE